MDAQLPNVYIDQCYTPKTRDIQWKHICQMSTLINALHRKLVIKWTHIYLMSTLINALPRKLVILNGRTFA